MIKQRTIDEILSSLGPAQKETIQNLRALIKSAVPETVEIVRQGKIAYKLNDKDFVWISHFQDHVDLEFLARFFSSCVYCLLNSVLACFL